MMQAYYKTKKVGKLDRYTLDKVNYCCDAMIEAFEDRAVIFGDEFGYDGNINIQRCYPYPEGAVFTEYAINFCPFCAEKIELVDVSSIVGGSDV